MFGLFKGPTIAEAYSDNREANNFNIIRVLAALMVIVSHSYLVVAQPSHYVHGLSLGSIGVDIFFVVSGFLVSGSYLHRNNPSTFICARFLRIWPGLMVNALLLAFVMGPLITTSPLDADFFLSSLKYVYANFLLLFPSIRGLPGVFADLKYPVLNNPLWTLNYEVIMYCLIGLMGLSKMLSSRRSMTTFLLAFIVLHSMANLFIKSDSLVFSTWLRFTATFFAGMALQIYKDKIRLVNWAMVLALMIFATLLYLPFKRIYCLPLSISMAYLVIGIALLPIKSLYSYNKLGDYSYGLYIYGWPVSHLLQTTLSKPLILSIATILLSLIPACLSWHLVERKMLGIKNLCQEVDVESYARKRCYVALFVIVLLIFVIPLILEPMWSISTVVT